MKSRSLFIITVVVTLVISASVIADEDDNGHVFKAKLRGMYEVNPVETKAHGNFVAHVTEDYGSLTVTLVANSIRNIVAVHIHLGGSDEDGPPVATLFGPAAPGGGRHNGLLAKLSVTAGDLMGPLDGEPLSRLILEMARGSTYINVHTDDGEGDMNTGPGDMASGEIRGQIVLKGMLAPARARLQVIHNAADPMADTVDVYADGDLLLDDFAFRTAAPFMDVPAMVPLQIGVAPGTSMSAADVIAAFDVTLLACETYVATASGVLSPSGFAPNPDGRDTGFTLFVKSGAREAAHDISMVEFFVLHGSTDAPTVDVIARDVAALVDDAAYGDMTGYMPVPPAGYMLDVTLGSDNATFVAAFEADLTGLAGGTAAVFASGFLDPPSNQDGPAFGLFAALPDGTVLEFPPGSEPSGGSEKGKSIPAGAPAVKPCILGQNFPNPFNPVTVIRFVLPEKAHVSLEVYDVAGREVAALVSGFRAAGEYHVTFNAAGLKSGVYMYRLIAGDVVETRKMILIR